MFAAALMIIIIAGIAIIKGLKQMINNPTIELRDQIIKLENRVNELENKINLTELQDSRWINSLITYIEHTNREPLHKHYPSTMHMMSL
ncbi:hypothetical protein [Oceanobacillus damuensis]|uniref:hypothetical protein n=1 Tax=Oceanobacillus damuensis TaxID=937928 RepID=UPI00083320DC|nr:hypothetical protein [Oceanobacillus damuensis]